MVDIAFVSGALAMQGYELSVAMRHSELLGRIATPVYAQPTATERSAFTLN
jgi:hypothetical protein